MRNIALFAFLLTSLTALAQYPFSLNFNQYADADWCYPLPKGAHIISPYGGNRRHSGTDIKRDGGARDTIRAAFPGEVTQSGPFYAYGNFVVIRHGGGLETAYSHNTKNLVAVGEWVTAGQPIAIVGRTGRATTDHLHFETRINGTAFDSSIIFDHNRNQLRQQKFIVSKKANGTLAVTPE